LGRVIEVRSPRAASKQEHCASEPSACCEVWRSIWGYVLTAFIRSLQSRVAPAIVWAICSAPLAVSAQNVSERRQETALWQEALSLRTQLSQESTDRSLAFRVAALEIAIGMPERALAVLGSHAGADSLWDETGFKLRGEAEYALGRFESAARSFLEAIEQSRQSEDGILAARAGASFDLAGLLEDASDQYAQAALQLPQLAGWLAVREAAASSDTTHAFRLLSAIASEAAPLAPRARGNVYVRAGDTSRAITVFERGGHPARAAGLSLAVGDSVVARRLAYLAIEAEDTTIARQGASIIEESFPPRLADEFLALAATTRRLGAQQAAVQLVAAAVAAGDSSAETLLHWGDLLAALRSRREALAAYGRAAAMNGEAARTAAFSHGRTLLLLGRADEGMAELTSFVARYPDHDAVPRALYGMADRRRRERRFVEADSLNKLVVEGWRRNTYASLARMAMSEDALARGDTAVAVGWYRKEIESRGNERNVAQYRLGSIRAAQGDTVAARGIWAALARADSLGYYGTIARTSARMPPLELEPVSQTEVATKAHEILSVLDLLQDAYLYEELELLLDTIQAERSRSPGELLDLAEGLIERGFVSEGIHLGWLASRSYTLNHPRVLRVVFPWPFRDLIEQKALELQLDPYLIAGLIRQESAFSPGVVSKAGAYGLMQLMPPTAREVARRIGADWDAALLSIADANLHLGTTHLAGLFRHYDQMVVPTLAAYNAGGTPVRRWLARYDVNDPVQFVEQIPYVETRGYVRTVLRNWALYRALYPARPDRVAGTP
jgi:soluble lytic murein transglycosylase-like protein/TolA-binding protein